MSIGFAPLNEEDLNQQVWRSFFESLGTSLNGDYYFDTQAALSAGISVASSDVSLIVHGSLMFVNIFLSGATTSGTQTITIDVPFSHPKTIVQSNHGTMVVQDGVITFDATVSVDDILITGVLLKEN